MDDDDYDEDNFWFFLTPLNIFITFSVLFLIIYIIYEKIYSKSTVSTSFICFAITGLILGIFILKFIGEWSSIIQWILSTIMTLGTVLFYYFFII